MRSLIRAQGRTVVIASILASALGIAAPATAEIDKCISKAGLTMYQNFPCQYDSNPEAPNVAMPATNAVPPKPAMPVAVAANTPNPAASVQAPDPTEPQAGMAADELRALLGEPLEIVQDTPAEGIETWRYLSRNVQVDHATRKVLEVASC